MLFGDKIFNIEGTMIFEDKENSLKAVIFFQHQKYDCYTGKIYHYSKVKSLKEKKEPTKLSEIKDIEQEICDINGSWLESLTIGDKEYWNIEKHEPQHAIPIPNPLLSDPRYREDLIWLKRNNEEFS